MNVELFNSPDELNFLVVCLDIERQRLQAIQDLFVQTMVATVRVQLGHDLAGLELLRHILFADSIVCNNTSAFAVLMIQFARVRLQVKLSFKSD